MKPRAHAEIGPAVTPVSLPQRRGSWLLNAVRRRAHEFGWRTGVDELRPHTQQLWRHHDVPAQARLLRHLRPYWDAHRHRLAPPLVLQLEELERSGRLQFTAGKLIGAAEEAGQVRLRWRARGAERSESMLVDRVINCTGPEGSLTRSEHPLVRDLLGQGRLRADAHGLGLDVDRTARVYDVHGCAQDRLFAVRPLTKGEAWEIVAVPDIRRQVWYLGNAHWVGGEGL